MNVLRYVKTLLFVDFTLVFVAALCGSAAGIKLMFWAATIQCGN